MQYKSKILLSKSKKNVQLNHQIQIHGYKPNTYKSLVKNERWQYYEQQQGFILKDIKKPRLCWSLTSACRCDDQQKTHPQI